MHDFLCLNDDELLDQLENVCQPGEKKKIKNFSYATLTSNKNKGEQARVGPQIVGCSLLEQSLPQEQQ